MTTIYKRLNPVSGEWDTIGTRPSVKDQEDRAFEKMKAQRHPPRPPDHGAGTMPDWLLYPGGRK